MNLNGSVDNSKLRTTEFKRIVKSSPIMLLQVDILDTGIAGNQPCTPLNVTVIAIHAHIISP